MASVRASITVLAMAFAGVVSSVIGGTIRLVAGVATGLWGLVLFLGVALAVRLGEAVERARHSR